MSQQSPAFTGTPLLPCRSAGMHRLRHLPLRAPTAPARQTVRAITRKKSDIRRPEDSPPDKEGRKKLRIKKKNYERRQRRTLKDEPRGYGNRPGIGFGPVGSVKRMKKEREARLEYLESAPGTRDALRRHTGLLSGGKADFLLHVLRARYIERMYNFADDEEVVLTEPVGKVYERLIDEILLCDKLYYADEPKPRITDAHYDELVMHLLELERCFPELITPRSPSQNVAHGAAVRASVLGLDNEVHDGPVDALRSSMETVSVTTKLFPQYRHISPMLSLDNAYNHNDLVSFVTRATEAASALSAELKIDGVALSLEYRNGQLAVAATRGTGRIGDAITENVRAALLERGVVETIPGPDVPSLVIVRGEVYITPKDFEEVNEGLERKLSNPRNAAAGALKHKVPEEAKERRLRFIAYDCLKGNKKDSESDVVSETPDDGDRGAEADSVLETMWPTQSETLQRLAEWGFGEMPRHTICDTLEQAEQFALRAEDDRSSLPLEVDGIVFKFNDSAARDAAGHTARAPRGAVAYKFAAQSKITVVDDVVMQVSRNGLITPVAILSPVRVGGALLSRATLHNFDEVKRLGVAIGDRVRVERGGDVIPKVTHVLETEGTKEGRMEIAPPELCPSCHGEIGTVVDEDTGTTLVACKNSDNCSAQTLGRVVHFAGKKAMNIVGFGRVTAQKLVNSGHVVVLADIFRLTKDDMLSLEGFAEKSASSVCKAIEDASSSRSLERLIYGLGLPGVGSTTARALALHLGDFLSLLDIGLDEKGEDILLAVPNVAEKSAKSIHEFLSRPRTQAEMRALNELVSPNKVVDEEDVVVTNVDGKIAAIEGKTFVFTGKLVTISRPEVMKTIRSAGGKITSTVSNKTDYVVVGIEPGSKFFKAQRMGRRILKEEEFISLFKYKPGGSFGES